MRAKHLIIISIISLISSFSFAQNTRDVFSGQNNDRSSSSVIENMFQQKQADYKVISSNSSYLELEFTPLNVAGGKIMFNNESLDLYGFDNSVQPPVKKEGDPDIRYREFNVAFPSNLNNTVTVIDYDVKEIKNVDLAPVPFVNFINRGVKGFESMYYSYIKGSKYYDSKFYPENIATIGSFGEVRELTTGRLNLYPLQYNPSMRVMKIYTRIRVRVSFGQQPLPYNRPRTKQEVELLKDIALNSDQALAWLNPKYKDAYKQNLLVSSVLATGDWYKIEVKDNGDASAERMYKITRSFLTDAGINVSGIDPRTIKLYGNGGYLLPEGLAATPPGDLGEIAVYFEGENDGSFDANDYILFYGRSTNNWRYDTTGRTYFHYTHQYSNSDYYWICLNTPGNGKRMAIQPSSPNAPGLTPTSFKEHYYWEPEEENLLNEGTLWLSHRKIPGDSFIWNISLNGLENNSEILYRVKPASRCIVPPDLNMNYMLIKDDFSTMSEIYFPMETVTIGFGNWIWTGLCQFNLNQSQKTNGEQVKLRATYMSNSNTAEGYMDWMEVLYYRRLNSVSGDFLRFDSPDTTATVEYRVSPFSNDDIKVFDATDHNNVKLVQPASISGGTVIFRKDEVRAHLSKFFAVGRVGYRTPTGISAKINNQNLRGITDGASFVIITSKDLLPAANRLKAKRESGGVNDPSYLKTLIVTVDQLYNEFSGGVLDVVAFRNFLRYAYQNWSERPVYTVMFGDGDFDYKGFLGSHTNHVPPYEITSPMLNQVDGYTTDDFYTNVVGEDLTFGPPDISVGRIPANGLQPANDYIDKIDCYESGQYNGYWKNKMIFVADDQMTSDGCETVPHLAQTEELSEFHTPPYIEKIKIYLVTYPTVITPQGRRKPQVNADIVKYWNQGAINIHYTGHGSPDVWAHEYVLEKDPVLAQLNNECRYPFVSIASCDMSKFDNPSVPSAGELFMITPRKGAIGTLAATRPVYSDGNAALMQLFFDNLYMPRDTLLLQRRFGKGLFLAKQVRFDPNTLKYVLMCDPTIRNQLPRFRSRVDSIAGLNSDTMRALSRVRIFGSIIHPDSSFWSDFNGSMILKVFDVDRHIQLTDECGIQHNFRLNGGIIYSGTQRISNGTWTAEFVVPKDLSYLNQRGKLIDYFFNTSADGAGIYTNFFVGGVDPTAAVDSIGPVIKQYLNTRNFRSGDIVNPNYKLIADLFDESGINTTGTIGHKIEGVLDGNENNKYDFTNFYNSDTSYKSGTLEYDFTDIALGKHRLKLKAWDTYNNSSEAEIEFTVSDQSSLSIVNMYNYPNPFKDNTTFTFQHNYPDPINVKIKIFTVAGRLIKEIDQQNVNDKFVYIPWTGKDADGETLGNGVYIYKLIVETIDGQSVTNIGKLAVLK